MSDAAGIASSGVCVSPRSNMAWTHNNCWSDEPTYWLLDGMGIELAKVCDKCVEKVKAQYDPDIFTGDRYHNVVEEKVDED